MKNLIPIILIAVFSSSLIAGKCDTDELEKQKLASLTSDASTYRSLGIMLKNREDIIIPSLTISLQTELELLTSVSTAIEKNGKSVPDIKVLLTANNDKLCRMIVAHPDFFEYDRMFLRLADSLLFDLPMSENNRLELLQLIRKHYSAKEIEQERSNNRYKIEITETNDETIIFMAYSCLAHYDDLLQITDFLQKGNRDAFKAFLSCKLSYIDSQIKIMIAASPGLASYRGYQDYIKNDPINRSYPIN